MSDMRTDPKSYIDQLASISPLKWESNTGEVSKPTTTEASANSGSLMVEQPVIREILETADTNDTAPLTSMRITVPAPIPVSAATLAAVPAPAPVEEEQKESPVFNPPISLTPADLKIISRMVRMGNPDGELVRNQEHDARVHIPAPEPAMPEVFRAPVGFCANGIRNAGVNSSVNTSFSFIPGFGARVKNHMNSIFSRTLRMAR